MTSVHRNFKDTLEDQVQKLHHTESEHRRDPFVKTRGYFDSGELPMSDFKERKYVTWWKFWEERFFLRADGSWKISGREISETWKNKNAKQTSTIVES